MTKLKLLKLTIVVSLLLIVCVSPSNAAFLLKKGTNQATVASNSSVAANTTGKIETKRESKKELKSYFKGKGHGGFGSTKSKTLAAILAVFLGSFGVHSFYMGQTGKGFAQLGGTILGIVLYAVGIAGYLSGTGASFPVLALVGYLIILGVSIWAFVDFIRILTGGLEPEEGFDS